MRITPQTLATRCIISFSCLVVRWEMLERAKGRANAQTARPYFRGYIGLDCGRLGLD